MASPRNCQNVNLILYQFSPHVYRGGGHDTVVKMQKPWQALQQLHMRVVFGQVQKDKNSAQVRVALVWCLRGCVRWTKKKNGQKHQHLLPTLASLFSARWSSKRLEDQPNVATGVTFLPKPVTLGIWVKHFKWEETLRVRFWLVGALFRPPFLFAALF